jgi:3-phenylpropionate/trans-cinnamate dioxygenase ferredoxin reductase subunit
MAEMSDSASMPTGPDLRAGYPADRLRDHGMVLGHVDGEPVVLVRRGAVVYAVQATCPHYGASLADGIVAGDTIRCPLHHACFDLSTGRALRAPALSALACYEVERRLDLLVVRGRVDPAPPLAHAALPRRGASPSNVVIIGTGAAGTAAALELRERGYLGRLTLIGAERDAPYDRPNLSKDYLAGTAPEEWLPMVPPSRFEDHAIRLALGTPVTRIDTMGRTVWLRDGRAFAYDALLLTPGASPLTLQVPGANLPHVHTLRSLADARALRTRAGSTRTAVVAGGGFIAMEAAAALTRRGIAVHVVSRDELPMVRALGAALGMRIRQLHESRGVTFHPRRSLQQIGESAVTCDDGTRLEAELVLAAIGVRPNTALAAAAGLVLNKGILVDRFLETSVRGIFAAGDVARWPDPRTGEPVRFEHWTVAERQGQTAARNMLGGLQPFEDVPFFWTEQFETRITYVGHGSQWDRIEVRRDLPPGEWEQRHFLGDVPVGVATIGRDRVSLSAELALEQGVAIARGARRVSAAVTQDAGRAR